MWVAGFVSAGRSARTDWGERHDLVFPFGLGKRFLTAIRSLQFSLHRLHAATELQCEFQFLYQLVFESSLKNNQNNTISNNNIIDFPPKMLEGKLIREQKTKLTMFENNTRCYCRPWFLFLRIIFSESFFYLNQNWTRSTRNIIFQLTMRSFLEPSKTTLWNDIKNFLVLDSGP